MRREVPDGALEEVGPRVRHPGGLRAGHRMPADEARVVDRGEQVALGGTDVTHGAARSGGRQGAAQLLGQGSHRRAGEAQVGAVERFLQGVGGVVDGAALERQPQVVGVAPATHHLRALDVLAGGQTD